MIRDDITVCIGNAEEDFRCTRIFEVMMEIIFPGEANTTVKLDGVGCNLKVSLGARNFGRSYGLGEFI